VGNSLITFKARLKNCRKSATIWFNTMVGSVILVLPTAQEQLPQLESYLPHNFYQVMMGVVVFANIALRFKTTSDLADKGK
jgi:hypothetical protein